VLAVPEEQGAEPVPERRQAVVLEPREGRHAEDEPTEASGLSPQQQELGEEELHHARRSAVRVAHQVDRELLPVAPRPEIREGDDRSPRRTTPTAALQIGGIEEAQREALPRGCSAAQPLVGDGAQGLEIRGDGVAPEHLGSGSLAQHPRLPVAAPLRAPPAAEAGEAHASSPSLRS
jgi:hypothetical protein